MKVTYELLYKTIHQNISWIYSWWKCF